MSNQTPALDTVLKRAVRVALRGVRVALPGRIESYDPATQQASVQPLVQDTAFDETGARVPERLPVVTNVPCCTLGGAGSRLTFPIAKGDECLLIFASSAIDRWLTLGGEVDPKDTRHHHLTDAFALVGFSSQPHATPAHATATVLVGSDIRLGDDTAVALATKADVTALANFVQGLFVGGTGSVVVPPNTVPQPVGTTKVKAK